MTVRSPASLAVLAPPRGRRLVSACVAAVAVAVPAAFLGPAIPGACPASAAAGIVTAAVGDAGLTIPVAVLGVVDGGQTPQYNNVEAGLVDLDTLLPGATGAGTGIVLSGDGEVLTNAHVVATATRIVATDVATGRGYNATVLGVDTGADIAVLRLTGAAGLPVAALADSDTVHVGDQVAAVGNAGGRGGATVSVGAVTGLSRSVLATDTYRHQSRWLHELIETSAVVAPGDSGGPLVTTGGKVIGVDTAGGDTAGFAIPIDAALRTVHRISPSTGADAASPETAGSPPETASGLPGPERRTNSPSPPRPGEQNRLVDVAVPGLSGPLLGGDSR